jgi:hypothetical protein
MTPEDHYREAESRLSQAETADNALHSAEDGDDRQTIVHRFSRHVTLAKLHLSMAETGRAFKDDAALGSAPQELYAEPSDRSYGFLLGTNAERAFDVGPGNWRYFIDFPGKALSFISKIAPQEKAFKARTFTDPNGQVGVDVRTTADNALIEEWIFG